MKGDAAAESRETKEAAAELANKEACGCDAKVLGTKGAGD